MGELAATPRNAQRFQTIDAQKVSWLETQVDRLAAVVRVLGEFIVPGDTASGAAFDLARTVVRRAERRVADLFHRGELANPHLLRYLNRLSSFCCAMELRENQIAGSGDITLARTGEDQ